MTIYHTKSVTEAEYKDRTTIKTLSLDGTYNCSKFERAILRNNFAKTVEMIRLSKVRAFSAKSYRLCNKKAILTMCLVDQVCAKLACNTRKTKKQLLARLSSTTKLSLMRLVVCLLPM